MAESKGLIKTLEAYVKEQDHRFAGFSQSLKNQVEDRFKELQSEVMSEMNRQILQVFEHQAYQMKDHDHGFSEFSQNLKNLVEERFHELQSELKSQINSQISQMFENQMRQMKELFINMSRPDGSHQRDDAECIAARSGGESAINLENNHVIPKLNPDGNPANWRDKIGGVELTVFSGEKPKEWLRKCDKFFTFHQIHDPYRVRAAELFLEGRAEIWFLSERATKGNWTWTDFSECLLRRFSEVGEKDVVEEFKKLYQRTSVGAYREKFEDLRSLMIINYPGLPEPYFISSFISGLKEELKPMVRVFQPGTLDRAVEISVLQEQHLEILNRRGRN